MTNLDATAPIDWDGAIQQLRERGLTKAGCYEDSDGAVCALGAVALAHGFENGNRIPPPLIDAASAPLAPVIREEFRERVTRLDASGTVAEFSDHEDTTLDDVVLVFEKARGSSWA